MSLGWWTTCGQGGGSYRELFSGVTLVSFRRRPVECSPTWAKSPHNRRGMCSKLLFLVTAGLPPPSSPVNLHTDTFSLPRSEVIHEWKRNLVFTVRARLLLHHEQSQGCGVGGLTSSPISSVEPKRTGADMTVC